jgi:hypothetical protein
VRQAGEYFSNHASLYPEQVGELHFFQLGAGSQAMIKYCLFDLAQYVVFTEFSLVGIFELR